MLFFECKASLDFFLPENAKYLIAAAQRLTAVLEKAVQAAKKNTPQYLKLMLQWKQSMTERLFCKYTSVPNMWSNMSAILNEMKTWMFARAHE